jgi:hypothetical protein
LSKVYKIFFLFLFLLKSIYPQDTRSLSVVVSQLGDNCFVGKQYVFLIAIDKYEQWFPLGNPVKDAKEIRDILISRYFIDDIIELYDSDATKAGIIKIFNGLQKKLQPHDSLLIFFTGHGHLDRKTNTGFWIPVNAGTDSFEQLH